MPLFNSSSHAFSLSHIFSASKIHSQAQALQSLGTFLSPDLGIHARILIDRLTENQKQKPALLKDGVAIAHMSVSGLKNSALALMLFKTPVDMGAADGSQIACYFLILTPEREGNSYLQTFSRLSRFVQDHKIGQRIKLANDESDIRALFAKPTTDSLAA